jgi:transposase
MFIRITSSSVHLDADGGVLAEETVTAQYSAVKTWVEALDPGATTTALESCYAWEYIHDLAQARGIRVLVADPALLQPAVKQRANKNDRDEGKNLAKLARLDLLPLVHPVERRYRELRALTRHRIFLTQTRTSIKNHVHFLLDRAGVKLGGGQRRCGGRFRALGRAFIRGHRVFCPMATAHPPRNPRLEGAQKFIELAREEAKKGYGAGDYRQVRDAAEKTWLAVGEAVNEAMARHGKSPAVGRGAHAERRAFLGAFDRGLATELSYFADALHGDCFYDGHCPTKEGMEAEIAHAQQFIDRVKRL